MGLGFGSQATEGMSTLQVLEEGNALHGHALDQTGFESWFHSLLAGLIWASYLSSLHLNGLKCKLGMITVLFCGVVVRIT